MTAPSTTPSVTATIDALAARPGSGARILHTSDWHLGVAVRNVPRDVDHDAVIAEIVSHAAVAEPDLIVHTGDLFHGGRPGMADFARAIRALRSLAEIAPVVVLAGNHDSAVALETLGIALEDPVPRLVAGGGYDPHAACPARIRILHRPATAAKGAVATYPTATGGRVRLVGLPFLHANRVLDDFVDIHASHATYSDAIAGICARLAQTALDVDFEPVHDVAVFASHLHVSGARTSSEKEIHVGTEYATDPAYLESRYGYLAFGHIHISQPVAGGRGRYAGSILEVDFGEEGETKQLVVADLIPGRRTDIHDVALTAGRRLHRVRAPYSALADHAAAVGDGLVEVTVELEPDAVGEGDVPDTAEDTDGTGEGDSGADRDGDGVARRRVDLDIPGFDTLNDAVHAAFPDATVVAVVDARRPDTPVADEIDLDDITDSIPTLFRAWFADHGSNLIARANAHDADSERICELFDAAHDAVTTDSDVDVDELATLADLTAEETA